jgi:hypothetical protein
MGRHRRRRRRQPRRRRLYVAHAVPGPSESTTVNVTPERVLNTRDGNDLGLPGPFVSAVSQKLQITGPVPTASGVTKTVVPAGATGVLLNVTSVSSQANGFISIRPGDATGTATTSSLNITAGVTVANAVQVALPTTGANAGKIDITYDALGTPGPTTDILIDIAGYTTTGLQQLITDTPPMFATINTNGAVLQGRASRLVSSTRTAVGAYTLTFDRSLAGCAAVGSDLIFVETRDVSVDPTLGNLSVRVTNSSDALVDSVFSVIVQCPQSGAAALDTGEPSPNAD